MNKLPASWGVLNDGSQLFKDTVIKYLYEHHDSLISGNESGLYYGIDCEGEPNYLAKSWFDQILTLEDFIELSKEESIKLTESNIKDYGFEVSHYNEYWINYRNGDLIVKFYLIPQQFEYENIKIDTIEELKMLYKLVTKKELI